MAGLPDCFIAPPQRCRVQRGPGEHPSRPFTVGGRVRDAVVGEQLADIEIQLVVGSGVHTGGKLAVALIVGVQADRSDVTPLFTAFLSAFLTVTVGHQVGHDQRREKRKKLKMKNSGQLCPFRRATRAGQKARSTKINKANKLPK